MAEDWRGNLEEWLAPFLLALRHKTRLRLGPAYIVGLIGPGDRKSVQPMAARDGEFGYDQLHHFVADGVCVNRGIKMGHLPSAASKFGGDGQVCDMLDPVAA